MEDGTNKMHLMFDDIPDDWNIISPKILSLENRRTRRYLKCPICDDQMEAFIKTEQGCKREPYLDRKYYKCKTDHKDV